MRVLVTGRGSIAQRHVRHLRNCVPAVELVVVAPGSQIDPALHPCITVPDFALGLKRQPDAVIIASPSLRHAAELEACLRLGLPCLAEKPLAISSQQLGRLKGAAKAAARAQAVVVGCNLRYLPVLQRVATHFRDGGIGRLMRAHFEVGQDLREWRPSRAPDLGYSGRADQGGGVVFDLVHEIDLALWVLGPLRVVGAVGGHFSGLPIDSDDVHVALLRSESGAPVTISLDYIARPAVRRQTIVGEAGTLTCDIMGRQLTGVGGAGSTQMAVAADFDVGNTYHHQMKDWIASIRDHAHAVGSPLGEGLATAELMLAMKEAA